MNLRHFQGLLSAERIDPVTVCHIAADLAALLGGRRGRVSLSRDTMDKQRAHHPDLTEADYRVLAATIACGEYRQDTPRSAQINYTDAIYTGRSYRAALKACARGKLWVISFNILRDRDLRKMRRAPYPIIRQHD